MKYYTTHSENIELITIVRVRFARCRRSSASSDVVRECVQCYLGAQLRQSTIIQLYRATATAETQLGHQLGPYTYRILNFMLRRRLCSDFRATCRGYDVRPSVRLSMILPVTLVDCGRMQQKVEIGT